MRRAETERWRDLRRSAVPKFLRSIVTGSLSCTPDWLGANGAWQEPLWLFSRVHCGPHARSIRCRSKCHWTLLRDGLGVWFISQNWNQPRGARPLLAYQVVTVPIRGDWLAVDCNNQCLSTVGILKKSFCLCFMTLFSFQMTCTGALNLTMYRTMLNVHMLCFRWSTIVGRGGRGEPTVGRSFGYYRIDHYQDGAVFLGRTSIYTGRVPFKLNLRFVSFGHVWRVRFA